MVQPRRATSSHGGPGAAPTAAVALVRLVRLLAAALLLASVLLLVALVDQSVAAAAPPADRGSTAAAASRPAADVAVGGAGRPTAGMPRAAPGGRNPRPPALAEYADALGEAVAVLRRSPSDLVQGNLPAARRARATATPAAGEGPGVPPSPPAPSFQMWWPGSRDEREGEPLQPDGDGEPVNPAWDRALQLFPIGPPVYEVPPSPVSAGPGRVLPGPTGHPSIDEETGDRLYRWFLFPATGSCGCGPR
ncbi:MAG TPA: hypothetical protein VKG45_10095 [Actinomycetes bacterium]|nr:hypothetical protein [Actinomycetes bacterium]